MASQTDLDQGGTPRSWVRQYLGPSIGWVFSPADSTFTITAGGAYPLASNTSLVLVNVAALVSITLPSIISPVPPITIQPIGNSITVNDIGGNAGSFTITIFPFAGQNIKGLASIAISSNYGTLTLLPNGIGGWDTI